MTQWTKLQHWRSAELWGTAGQDRREIRLPPDPHTPMARDRYLLGMRWNGSLYVDVMLPFGLRSAPKIFTAVADALEWCISQHGVEYIFHYLDDFLIMGPPGSSICQENLQKLIDMCSRLGVPLVADKQEGPSPILTFLGRYQK